MPEVSRFHGIVIRIHYGDHEPPHFHVKTAEAEASISIQDLRVVEGWLRSSVRRRVLTWAAIHQSELMWDWDRIQTKQPFKRIAPLR